ncbi:MAG: type II secretion system secretin GspD [Acidobacteria bacterium]|nr:type II secretion system secretin GspD [Acidobacteriota bacterium]
MSHAAGIGVREMHALQLRKAEKLNRKWTTAPIIGVIIITLLCPNGLIGWQQSATSDEQKREGATAPGAPSSPAQSEEEYIEVERDTPFGKQRFRVPKSSVAAPPSQGQSPAPQVVPAPTAPANQPAGPAALQSQQPAPGSQPPAAPPTPPQAVDATVPIALHLENANLLQVIGIIAAELKMNYVVDPAVTGSVNINTLGEVRRSDLFPLLQMILRINGATAVQVGNFFRIVPLKDVQRLPIEPLFNPEAGMLAPDDRMVMNIIPLKYVSAPDMTKILTPFLSEGGHLFSHDAGNILVITDSSRSMKRLLELVGMFDTEVFSDQRARLYQIKHGQATKLAAELKDIFSAYGLSGSPAVRFVPIDRINSVLAVTANPSVYSEVEKWLEKLDQPRQESGIRNFIYKVENGKAADLAGVLIQLLGGPPPQQAASRPGAPPGLGGVPVAQAPPVGAMPGSAGELSHIRIVPDVVNNQILVQSTAQEFEQIQQTLKDLDIIPRQVMIEAKVYEVDLTGSLSAGVSAFLQNRTSTERKPLGSFASAQGVGAASLSASIGTLVGKTRELMLFLNALETRNQARVISAPSILASDNIPANINVGTQIPVLTSQALVAGAQVGGSSLFTNTIQNQDTGVLLSITPRINSSGLVNLQIQQEVSAPLEPTGAIQSPSIQKRAISTQIVVDNGDTIALGGIIQENRQLSRNRVPLLGNIPYLGLLFGNTSLSSQRTELIILVTPTVIRNRSESQRATAELRDKLRDLRRILEDEEKEQKERERRERKQSDAQAGSKQAD